MRYAFIFVTSIVLLACGDIAPVETVDLCKGDDPPSNDCPQCKTPPFAKECPKCKGNPLPGCANASDAGGGSGHGGGGSSGVNGGGGSGHGGDGGSNAGSGGEGAGSGGILAMDGGSDAAIDGGHACGPCKDNWTKCAGNECAQCLKDEDCGDDHCDTQATHACVQCVKDDQCKALGLVCDEDMHACVQCVLDTDCKDPKLPQCRNNVCSLCDSQAACEGRQGFGNCDTATGSATKGQCVECLAHKDCENPKPQCNSKRECVQCSGGDEACVGREGATVCDEDEWAGKKGTCVQCTGEKYAKCKHDGKDFVCESLTRKCSTDDAHQEAATGVCGECVSDAECVTGMKCVHMTYGTPEKDVGWFCQWEESGTGAGSPHGDCANAVPFVKTVPLSSSDAKVVTIDREMATICTLAVSTCPAYTDYKATDCDAATSPPAAPDDGLCGFDYSVTPAQDESNGRQDAYCDMFSSGSYLCTMRCSAPNDCPNGNCNTTTHHCGF